MLRSAGIIFFILMTSVSASAQVSPPNPPCDNVSGTTATCTGNVSGGVSATGFPNPVFTTLNVNSLTQAIMPASGVEGILLDTSGSDNAIINADTTGTTGITTTNAAGISSSSRFNLGAIGGNTTVATTSGGSVAIDSTGDVATSGVNAYGLTAISSFSIGGIGTTNNVTNATGGDVSAVSVGEITTTGGSAHGVNASSSFNVSGISTSNTVDTASGAGVVISNTGNVMTSGSSSDGLNAESRFSLAASGGTNNVTNATANDVSVTSVGDITTTGAISRGVNATFRYGVGSGGTEIVTNAIGAGVTVSSTGNVTTSGDSGSGLNVESIFAIGGINNISTVTNATAGDISVTSVGNLITTGDLADGIVVSSTFTVGGINSNNTVTNATTSGITVNNTGNITTSGNVSNGISVSSRLTVSGIGGTNTITNASFGDITINSTGIIAATGSSSDAVNADATGTTADIAVNVLGGTVTGGSIGSAGVRFTGGTDNRLANYGAISALSGLAVDGTSGSETIDNYGTITGNLTLGGGANAFFNMSGGQFNSGTTANLGAGNVLMNNGVLNPGGAGTIVTTTLTGNFVQTAGGVLAVDVNIGAGTADRLNAGAGTATVAGTVIVTPTNVAAGTTTVTIISANGGVTDNGLALGPLSPAVQAQLLTFANRVDLSFDVNFATVTGLNPNQTAIANNLNAISTAGGGALGGALNGLLNVNGVAAYQKALDQLSPELYNLALIETLYASQQFSNDMMSCRVVGEDGFAVIHEGQCLWLRARARFLELDRTANNIGADDTTGSFSAGAQFAFAPDWRLGVAAGYDTISLDTTSGAATEGDRANLGAIVKYNPGPLLVAAGITGGWGSYDTTRPLSFGGFNGTATSSTDIDYLSGQLHAAYLISQNNWYLKPLVDAGVVQLRLDGFTERGGNGVALTAASQSNTVYYVSPAIELGTELRFDDLAIWRPFVRAGLTWQSDGSLPLSAEFIGAPQGVGPFMINNKIDDVLFDVAAGVDVINDGGTAFRVQYDGRFGSDTSQNSISLKGSVPF